VELFFAETSKILSQNGILNLKGNIPESCCKNGI